MCEFVVKRNGNKEKFDFKKIKNAIEKAELEVYGTNAINFKDLFIKINDKIYMNEVKVEDIQDVVEDCLMQFDKKIARAYIRYRYKHEMLRDNYKILMDGIEEKLMAKDVQNQNANVDEYSFGGRIGEMSDFIMKHYALENCISKKAKDNHLNNRIYIHDLSHYAVGDHNCLSCPIDKLLEKGFTTRQVDIRPANSVSTALQLVAVIFQIQSLCQFGGVSATHLDWSLVPYVRKSFTKYYLEGVKLLDNKEYYTDEILKFDDKRLEENKRAYDYAIEMTVKETYQACEGLFHNLNSLQSRSGNQLN